MDNTSRPTMDMIFLDKDVSFLYFDCNCHFYLVLISLTMYYVCSFHGLGDKIHAPVKKFEIEKWKEQLKDGISYILKNFEVEAKSEDYILTTHNYKFVFGKGTKVKVQGLLDISKIGYRFTKFEDINNGKASIDVLIGNHHHL